MIRKLAVAALVAACLAAPAAANDSVASLRAGGLVLERTDGIVMRSEDLYVSAREIRVDYRFFNRTDRDIVTLVAFPMPDIVGRPEGDLGLPGDDPLRLTPFRTTVDGRAVSASVEQKAVVGGVDHSELLRGLGVPLAPHLAETGAALAALPRPQIDMLVEMALIEDRSWTMDGRTEVDLAPLWTLKTTHYWAQVFPAGRELRVHHRYVPAVGRSAGSAFGDPELMGSEYLDEQAATYCADDAFTAAAARMRRRGLYLTETWIDYVLTTGANWAEPIGEFRLVVDKGSPANLVSFCADGVRRLDSTRFEVRRRNFTSERDLSVLILTGVRLDD